MDLENDPWVDKAIREQIEAAKARGGKIVERDLARRLMEQLKAEDPARYEILADQIIREKVTAYVDVERKRCNSSRK